MSDLMIQQYGQLIVDCLIIAIETIGIVKFLDNFLFPKRDLSLREKCTIELVTCIACAFLNSVWVPKGISNVCNLFLLSLSLTQLAYDCIVNGIKHLIDKAFKAGSKED